MKIFPSFAKDRPVITCLEKRLSPTHISQNPLYKTITVVGEIIDIALGV